MGRESEPRCGVIPTGDGGYSLPCDLERGHLSYHRFPLLEFVAEQPRPRPPCEHHDFHCLVQVNRLTDTGRFTADITIRCLECKEPFRFLGPSPGVLTDRPTVSIDGLELRCPIEPEGEKRLFTKATFQMSSQKGNA